MFHPVTGSTYMMSPWALALLDLVGKGYQDQNLLLDALCLRADKEGQIVERQFFFDLTNELIGLDFLVEKSAL